LTKSAGYVMRVPITDGTVYEAGTCICQKVSYGSNDESDNRSNGL
jgi:hypothetical protein